MNLNFCAKLGSTMMIFVLAGQVAMAIPQPMPKDKEDRILSILFDNQTRKTISTEAPADCRAKGPRRSWSCDHKTVKSVLMNALFVEVPAETLAKHNRMQCELVTKELKGKVLTMGGFEWGPVMFRREVVQALDGQWACTFSATLSRYEELLQAKHEEEKINVSPAGEPTTLKGVLLQKTPPHTDVHTSVFGITFLLNRDQSRIVSRTIVAWSNF